MQQSALLVRNTWQGSAVGAFDYKAATRGILPRLAATAEKSERLRRLDDDAAAALQESGLARVLTPTAFGGFELSPGAHIWTCAELAHSCSAASWVLMVCVAHDYIIGRFSDECQREVYDGDADNLLAGALAPQGVLERVKGGWRLSGRWQFGSGCDHSPWFIFGARVTNPGNDDYLVYHVMVPRSDVMIDDTWHTLGMRGTGSKDLVVENVFVPDHRAEPTYPTFVGLGVNCKSPLYRLPVYAGLSSMLSGSVLGMAERGLEKFIEVTGLRRTAHGISKADGANMQRRVAESSAEIAAARRLLDDMCRRFDNAMLADGPMTTADRVQFRWDAACVVEFCRRAIDRIYSASGAHGVYYGNAVDRAFRDISTACHHTVVDFDTVSELRGKIALLGAIPENERAAPLA